MDFSRNSQYRPQAHTTRVSQKQRKEEPQVDYILLPDSEIAGCISDLGFPITKDDIVRPQPQQIQRIFELIADIIHNTRRETVEPAMEEAAREICGEEHMGIVPQETRNLMGFFASLRKLINSCGVTDFSLTDLTKPTHPRLVRIFSHVINFLRFREQQADAMYKHADALVNTKERIDNLHTSNANLAARLDELRGQKRSHAEAHEHKTARNEKLKNKLRRLQKEQEQRGLDMESAKAEKDALLKQLQEQTARNVLLRQECDKLRPYSVASGSALQTQLNELHEALKRDKTSLAASEKRLRALHTSADAFSGASGDVAPCVGLLKTLQNETRAEEKEVDEANRRQDKLAEQASEVKSIERNEAALQVALDRWNERTEKLRREADERAKLAGEKMKQLGAEHKHLLSETAEKNRELEKRKVRAEQSKKKMADLKDNINAEVKAARTEYMKLKAHIELYITEMDQSI